MHKSALIAALLLAACSGDPLAPMRQLADPADATRRAGIELIVKAEHEALLSEIEAGGGPTLTRAFDAAGLDQSERPARILQLRGNLGLYAENPGALVTALSLYGL